MPNYTIKGTNNVEVGTGSTSTGAYGLGVVVSASRKDGAEKRELKDRDGRTYVVIYFDAKNQCEFKAIFDTTITIPAIGGVVPIGGLTDCLVDEIEHNWENTQERMLTIRATKYPGVALA